MVFKAFAGQLYILLGGCDLAGDVRDQMHLDYLAHVLGGEVSVVLQEELAVALAFWGEVARVRLDVLAPDVNSRRLYVLLNLTSHFYFVDEVGGEGAPKGHHRVLDLHVVGSVIDHENEGARRVLLVVVHSQLILLGHAVCSPQLSDRTQGVLIIHRDHDHKTHRLLGQLVRLEAASGEVALLPLAEPGRLLLLCASARATNPVEQLLLGLLPIHLADLVSLDGSRLSEDHFSVFVALARVYVEEGRINKVNPEVLQLDHLVLVDRAHRIATEVAHFAERPHEFGGGQIINGHLL